MKGEEEKIAVVARKKETQFEALRVALGAVLEDHKAHLFILDYKIDLDYMKTICDDCPEEFLDNLEFLQDMNGEISIFTNVKENEEYNNDEEREFTIKTLTLDEISKMLKDYGVIIPF